MPSAFESWTIDEVVTWLGSSNPVIQSKYETTFREQGVDGAMLTFLDDETLRNDLGIANRLHRKRLLYAINELRSSNKRVKTEDAGDVMVKAEEESGEATSQVKKEAKVKTEYKKDSGKKKDDDAAEEPTKKADDEKAAKPEEDEPEKEEEEEVAKEPAVAKAAETPLSPVPDSAKSNEIEICFSFDTTGSMYPCLGQVKNKIQSLVDRLLKDVPHMKIALVAHGDYEDEGKTYLMKQCNFCCDKEILCNWVEGVGSTCGFDCEEAYEYVLREVQSLAWSPTCVRRALVMIGDANPHTTLNNKFKIDWREQCRKLAKMDVRVHGVHALGYANSRPFYQEMAQLTGGMYLELSQFASIRDLILGVAFAEAGGHGAALLQNLQEEMVREGRMNRNMRRVFYKLAHNGADNPEADAPNPDGLTPCEPGRFQVMDIEEKVAIKVFAESQGLIFKTGKGFYEFTKPEKISMKKEVVMQRKDTGDFFTGDEARNMLGISDATANKKLKPTDFDEYRVFVQSTSYNRNLMPDTKFLYEVDADR